MSAEHVVDRHARAVAEPQTLTPLLVDEREARRLLGGLCAKTMYNLRRSGQLRGVKIGSRTLYDPDELKALVARQKEAGR